MPEVFITLEETAELEGIKYDTMQKRIKRNPEGYTAETRAREGGSRDQVMISVASLSPKARRAHKTAQKAVGRDVIMEQRTKAAPWCVGADLDEYIENNKRKYCEAIEPAKRVQVFIDYDGVDKAEFADRYAKGLGVSIPTLYRYAQNILTVSVWTLKLEREDGQSREYFRPLALCRKPKGKATFPSLDDEQRTVIEDMWSDREFAANLDTREMLYERFLELTGTQGQENVPSIKTINRYISYLMERLGAENAQYLATNGLREWKNKKILKGKRDAMSLEVMKYVVDDEHTFDFWIQWTVPNDKVKAVRLKLVAWLSMRSRCIMGGMTCVNADSQTLKESLVKTIYSHPDGMSQIIHVDNNKDYTAKGITGQNRKKREIKLDLDSETIGFYQPIGVQEVGRSLPYQPWDKSTECLFRTACEKFSRWFASYTGTLTSSKTYAKQQKDVDGMLECGELPTMGELFEAWTCWKNEKYHIRPYRGLKNAGEKWVASIELSENDERYEKAAPPREYAAILLIRADTALVRDQDIQKFGILYTDYELARYIGEHVGIKWDIDDVTKLYVFDKRGQRVCEAVSAELLAFGPHYSQVALEEYLRDQKRQECKICEIIDSVTRPYRERLEESGVSDAISKVDLTTKAERSPKVVQFPVDKEFRGRMAIRPAKKKTGAEGEFLGKKAGDALTRLRAMNE